MPRPTIPTPAELYRCLLSFECKHMHNANSLSKGKVWPKIHRASLEVQISTLASNSCTSSNSFLQVPGWYQNISSSTWMQIEALFATKLLKKVMSGLLDPHMYMTQSIPVVSDRLQKIDWIYFCERGLTC